MEVKNIYSNVCMLFMVEESDSEKPEASKKASIFAFLSHNVTQIFVTPWEEGSLHKYPYIISKLGHVSWLIIT